VSYELVSQIIVSFTYYLYRFMSHPQALKALMKEGEIGVNTYDPRPVTGVHSKLHRYRNCDGFE